MRSAPAENADDRLHRKLVAVQRQILPRLLKVVHDLIDRCSSGSRKVRITYLCGITA